MTTITVTNLSSNTDWGTITTNTGNDDTAYTITTNSGRDFRVAGLVTGGVQVEYVWVFPEEVYVTQVNADFTGTNGNVSNSIVMYNNLTQINSLPAYLTSIKIQQTASMAVPTMPFIVKNVGITYEGKTPDPPQPVSSNKYNLINPNNGNSYKLIDGNTAIMPKLNDIHILTQEEYNNLQDISQNDLYFVEDVLTSWVIFDQQKTIVQESPVATGVPTAYTLTDLPDANGEYELLLGGTAVTGSKSDDLCRVLLYPNGDTNSILYVAATRTRAASTVEDRAGLVYPIKGNVIYADIEGTVNEGTGTLWWYGYRRIG